MDLLGDRSQQVLRVLDSHGARLYRMLFRLTLREDVAEDLLQDLSLKLLHTEAVHGAKDLAAYAFRSAVNLGCDWRRRQRRAKPVVSLPAQLPGPATNPAERLTRQEERERILTALEGFSELARHCLVMRYLEEESVEAIAQQLGKTAHQVRAICSKGVAELRQRLGNREQGTGSREE